MTTQPPNGQNPYVITDTDTAIQMTIINAQLLFGHNYAYGSIEVHGDVVIELTRWVNKPNHPKVNRIGLNTIKEAIQYAQKHQTKLQSLTGIALDMRINRYDALENNLPMLKQKATSRSDKEQLVMAEENNCHLLTHDDNLRTLTEAILDYRALDLSDLLVELIEAGLFDWNAFQDAVKELNNRKERLKDYQRDKVMKALLP